MVKEWDAWKAQQRAAMAVQLELEKESLARLEAAKAANGSVHGGSVHGGATFTTEFAKTDPVWDKPGMTKVGGWQLPASVRCGRHALGVGTCSLTSAC